MRKCCFGNKCTKYSCWDIDRDERTNGKGIELLKNNDLNVSIENGVNDFLNPGYKIKNDKPYLIGKVATSADHIMYNEK